MPSRATSSPPSSRSRIGLLKRYKAAQERAEGRRARADDKAATKTPQDELNALILFKNDMGAFQRMYSFLSQIFDYGNTAIEKRFIFYRRLLPLLEFGREREGIDLSKVRADAPQPEGPGQAPLPFGDGEAPKLAPITEAGVRLACRKRRRPGSRRSSSKVNDLFEGELTDDDQLVYVNNVIKGKLLESAGAGRAGDQQHQGAVRQLARRSRRRLMNAIMDALAAHTRR